MQSIEAFINDIIKHIFSTYFVEIDAFHANTTQSISGAFSDSTEPN